MVFLNCGAYVKRVKRVATLIQKQKRFVSVVVVKLPYTDEVNIAKEFAIR